MRLALQHQPHRDRLAALQDPHQLLGVWHRECAGWNRLGTVAEAHHAGMRIAMMVGADRADNDRQRTLFAGDGRPLPPRSAELAISRSVLVGWHAMIDEHNLAADQII